MLRYFPHGRTARARVAAVMALSASLLVAAVTAPAPSVASGDGTHQLNHQKAQLNDKLANSHADLSEISGRLVTAQNQLDAAVSDLDSARARLATLQVEVQQATVRDQQMQQALDLAIERLNNAKADLARGQRTVSHQRSALVAYAVSNSQVEVTQLSTLGLVVNANSTHQAIDQVQGSNSALSKQLSDLQRLQANEVLLRYTEQRVQQATDQVAADRRAAAAQLATTQGLEASAASVAASVQQQVSALQAQRSTLASARTAELGRITTMQHERSQLEARLRKIAEQRAAAHQAALAAQAAAAANAASSASAVASGSTSGSGATSTASTDGGFLSWPVTNTYITSPYGMRLHPILHIWELHDGTDFHAVCGTPVYAAADGRVSSEYFNTGYGNRLIIDHGFVKGVSLWTSYNHLTSYVAHTGQSVSRGQLIAYSGTTGYSTGCHLHFMVYVNGATVDPMAWL